MEIKQQIRITALCMLAVLFLFISGCETVDTSVDIPDGRNSTNDRYEDDDIIGPVLKFKLKEDPVKQQEEELRLMGQSDDY